MTKWDERMESGPSWTAHCTAVRSGTSLYGIGEFVAVRAEAAIERAIEIFGAADEAKAEQIPGDAAPLPRPRQKDLA